VQAGGNANSFDLIFDLIISKFHHVTINKIISTTQTTKPNATIHNIQYFLIYMVIGFLKGGLSQ